MEALNQAITLLHQFRYVEAYEMVEKSDMDEATKNHYLIEIAHKQKQHLVKSLPQPFATAPIDLAETPVRLWLWLPYALAGLGIAAIIIYLNGQTLTGRDLGILSLLTIAGWAVGKVIARDQIKRYESRNIDRLMRSVHAMLRVYQHLIELDYRAAREVLESGTVMPNVARAWLNWLDRVHQAERRKAGLEVPQTIPPEKTDFHPGYFLLIMVLYFLVGFTHHGVELPGYSEGAKLMLVIGLVGWFGLWLLEWKWREFIIDAGGLLAFSLTVIVLSLIMSATIRNTGLFAVTQDQKTLHGLISCFFVFITLLPFGIVAIYAEIAVENRLYFLFYGRADHIGKEKV